ncbi:MAG: tyrosine--tRNA ligase, partial [Clostridium sp.]|nr:tyrosine--tRNA ligase [Clostridium sp.]
VEDVNRLLGEEDFEDNVALIKRGKKNYNKIEIN